MSMLRRVLPWVMTGVMLAILLALGTWQMQRKAWKEDLIARVEERVDRAPEPFPGPKMWGQLDPDRDDYRRVIAKGRFRHADTLYLYGFVAPDAAHPGRFSGQGWFVITPLETRKGVILVNRGFVPMDKREPASRPGSEPQDEVVVSGLLRFSEPRGAMAAQDDAAKRLYYTRDIAVFRTALGLDPARTAPVLLEADASPNAPLPQGGNTRVSFPNRHLEYALTWYGLAVALLVIFWLWRRKQASGEA